MSLWTKIKFGLFGTLALAGFGFYHLNSRTVPVQSASGVIETKTFVAGYIEHRQQGTGAQSEIMAG